MSPRREVKKKKDQFNQSTESQLRICAAFHEHDCLVRVRVRRRTSRGTTPRILDAIHHDITILYYRKPPVSAPAITAALLFMVNDYYYCVVMTSRSKIRIREQYANGKDTTGTMHCSYFDTSQPIVIYEHTRGSHNCNNRMDKRWGLCGCPMRGSRSERH